MSDVPRSEFQNRASADKTWENILWWFVETVKIYWASRSSEPVKQGWLPRAERKNGVQWQWQSERYWWHQSRNQTSVDIERSHHWRWWSWYATRTLHSVSWINRNIPIYGNIIVYEERLRDSIWLHVTIVHLSLNITLGLSVLWAGTFEECVTYREVISITVWMRTKHGKDYIVIYRESKPAVRRGWNPQVKRKRGSPCRMTVRTRGGQK